MIKAKVWVGLTNPKSPTNVGSAMRAAGCYQADAVYFTGRRYARAAKFNTDTKDMNKNIPLMAVDSFLDDIPEGMKVVCVELVEGAISLPQYQHPDQAFYIFGPEDGTLSQDVIDSADDVVYIPTVGCMNLAATVNVLLYDRLAKSETNLANDALIRKSRDTNNKVRVKAP